MDQVLQAKLKQLARQALDRCADHERLHQRSRVLVPTFHPFNDPALRSALTGLKGSNSPSPGLLQLRVTTNRGLLEANPAVLEVLEDPCDSFSPSGRTSPSVSDPSPSRCERCSPASLRVRDTQQRRSRCSGQAWNPLETFSVQN